MQSLHPIPKANYNVEPQFCLIFPSIENLFVELGKYSEARQ